MDRRIVEQVEDWDSRPFGGGYEGLRDLSSSEFSGAVHAAGVWLFLLNGRIVGVFDGTIETVEGAEGTTYGAPHQSLPLLYAMQEKSGDPRAKYYTNDTPISEVHNTLSSGTFTGFIELSENVLSGDYYQVYYGGRSMSVAFVGSSEQLLTDEEAFERADDEVGIYEVYEVDIEITEIPGGDTGTEASEGATPAEGGANHRGPASQPGGGQERPTRDAAPEGDSSPAGEDTPGGRAREDPTERAPDNTGRPTERAPDNTGRAREDPTGQRRNGPTGDDRRPDSPPGREADDRPDPGTEDDATADRGRRRRPGRSGGNVDRNSGDGGAADRSDSSRGDSGRRTGGNGEIRDAEPGRNDDAGRSDRENRQSRPGRGGQDPDRGANRGDSPPPGSGSNRSNRAPRTDNRRGSTDEAGTGRTGEPGNGHPDSSGTDPADSRPNDRGSGSPPEPGVGNGANRSETGEPETGSDGRRTNAGAEPRQQGGGGSPENPPDDRAGNSPTDTGHGGGTGGPDPTADGASGGDTGGSIGTVEGEAAWREAETIPSLDPDRTALPDEVNGDSEGAITEAEVDGTSRQGSRDEKGEGPGSAGSTQRQSATEPAERGSSTVGEDIDEPLDQEVLEREDQIDSLKQQVSNLEADNEDLRAERDELARTVDRLRDEKADLQAEVDHLESEIADLEAEIDRLESSGGGSGTGVPSSKRSLTPDEALAGTDLFVRYASKSEATLDDVHAGDATPEEVNENLRLEHHTRFESDDIVVNGRPFDDFLRGTLEYRFVDWFVTQLPYEIRDTGHVEALKDLYDGFPNVDRAELDADVTLQYQEDGEEIREQQTFDVVIRDRMGNPLMVANMNDSRDPASQEMMIDLKETADRVKESSDSLGASFLVTKSFFAPGALETASEATSGGFLSRDSRESYVKLSRKRGYHLCLVEARGDDFHLNVPEL